MDMFCLKCGSKDVDLIGAIFSLQYELFIKDPSTPLGLKTHVKVFFLFFKLIDARLLFLKRKYFSMTNICDFPHKICRKLNKKMFFFFLIFALSSWVEIENFTTITLKGNLTKYFW